MADGLNVAGLESAATSKIGPLPAWGWGLVVAGVGLVGYFVVVHGGGLAGSGTAATNSSATAADTAAGSGIPVDSSSDPSSSAGSTGTTAGSYTDNNQAWLARASSQVASEFGASPSDVYNALYTGLEGGTLTTTAKKYWDRALSDLGVPPEGTQGTVNVTPDPVVAKPSPVTVKPAPTPSPKPKPATPGKASVPAGNLADAGVGSRVTLSHSYSGYVTADAANAGGKARIRTGTGTYYVYNRVNRSHGIMLNVSRVKGVPGAWINP